MKTICSSSSNVAAFEKLFKSNRWTTDLGGGQLRLTLSSIFCFKIAEIFAGKRKRRKKKRRKNLQFLSPNLAKLINFDNFLLDFGQILPEFFSEVRSAENEYENVNSNFCSDV